MSSRRAAIAGVVLVALIGVVAWRARSGGESHESAPAAPTTASATPSSAPAASPAPVAAAAPVLPSTTGSDGEADRPQPVPLPPGANPPSLDGKKSEPAPPQKAFTPAEVIAKREADLQLLDDTKARLEKDLAAAQTAHDATTAHDLEIRIARLTELRKKRSSELDQLKGSAQ